VIAAIGLVVLVYVARHSTLKVLALCVYGVSLALMFSASAVYHLVKVQPKTMLFLRKLDHAAIYLLIAGTYTPICIHYFTGAWRWAPLAIIWSLAIVGIGVKVFVIKAPRWITAGIYLVMGWLGVAAVREVIAVIPTGAIAWLLLGGLIFTGGAVVYILKKPDPLPGVFGFHEIWHIFVILGALCHYILMAAFIAPSGLA
jgi:hemolysin III